MPAARSNRPPVWVWLLAVPVVLALLASVALTMLLPAALVKKIVADQLQAALRREVRFADARLQLWPPVRLSVQKPELAEQCELKHAKPEALALALGVDDDPASSRDSILRAQREARKIIARCIEEAAQLPVLGCP